MIRDNRVDRPSSDERIDALQSAITEQKFLAVVARSASTNTPGRITDIFTQDKYSHDVVVNLGVETYFVYDVS